MLGQWIQILVIYVVALLALRQSRVSAAANSAAPASNDSLLWGPYKPNLYFGIRPRIPESLFGGLIWAVVEDFQTTQSCKTPSLAGCGLY